MFSSTAVPIFMFGTLGIVVVILLALLISFRRKRANRHSMADQTERNIDEIQRGVGPGK